MRANASTSDFPKVQSLAEYQSLCDSFQLEVPEVFNFGFDVVDAWAKLSPDRAAMRWVSDQGEDRTITFKEMSQRTSQVADALLQIGLKSGDQVLVCLPNLVEWWETMVGLIKAGIVAIPATTQLTAKDIAFRINTAEVDAVVTDAGGAEKVDSMAADLPHLIHKIEVGGEPRTG